MAAMADDVTVLPTLTDEDQVALQGWVRDQGLGSDVTDVAPLTGGTQNIVVHLRIDDRPMVLRRPPRASPTDERQDDAARDRGVADSGRQRRAAPGVHRGLRRPQRAGRGLLPDGGGRRVQPGQRRSRIRTSTTPGCGTTSDSPMRRAWRSWAPSTGRAARLRRYAGRDPFWPARFRSSSGCWRAIGTNFTTRVAARGDRTRRRGWRPTGRRRRRTRHHARRRPSQQRAAAPRPPRVGGVHRLGDVHGRATHCWTSAG